jgi:hypothetical protein
MDHILFATAIALSLGVSALQARLLVGSGSDHPVHVFLARAIRERGHRLPIRIPGLLNPSYCSAYPLFLHWLLSFLPPDSLGQVARLLNPVVNTLLVVLVYVALKLPGMDAGALSAHAGFVALLYCLTPQFYQGNSARNYGISSRPIGILLIQVLVLLCFRAQSGSGLLLLAAGTFTAYAIWGFNTFAQQAMLLFGIGLGLVAGQWTVLAFAGASLVLFVLIHRDYAISYLIHTVQFSAAYATRLARVFVLRQRYSVWRDLVWDIWRRLQRSVPKGLRYAYDNPVLIVCFLNPLTVLGAYAATRGAVPVGFVRYCGIVAAVGGLACFATTLRLTRFLGEPERYIEMVTLVGTIAGAAFLLRVVGETVLWAVVGYFICVNVAQVGIVLVLRAQVAVTMEDLTLIEDAVATHRGGEPVRCCSNNEVVSKVLMRNPWSFVRFWSAEQRISGYAIDEAIDTFPHLKREPLEAWLREFEINVCVLDKTNFSEVFTQDGQDRRRIELLLDTERYRLYRIAW